MNYRIRMDPRTRYPDLIRSVQKGGAGGLMKTLKEHMGRTSNGQRRYDLMHLSESGAQIALSGDPDDIVRNLLALYSKSLSEMLYKSGVWLRERTTPTVIDATIDAPGATTDGEAENLPKLRLAKDAEQDAADLLHKGVQAVQRNRRVDAPAPSPSKTRRRTRTMGPPAPSL